MAFLIKNSNNPLNRPINLSNFLRIILILALIASNIFFIIRYNNLKGELQQSKTAIEVQELNEEVLEFTKLFIEEVLKAETEVDFETRLQLESAVRNLEDEEILAQWQKFVESETEFDAQNEVKNLLEILVSKVKVQ